MPMSYQPMDLDSLVRRIELLEAKDITVIGMVTLWQCMLYMAMQNMN